MARTPYIKKEKPPFPYERPLSYSQLSTFKWRKQDWYEKYVIHQNCTRELCALGEDDCPVVRTSPEMIFGSMVDKKIQEDPTYLPQVPRLKHLQYPLRVDFNGIPLVGYPDNLDLDNPHLRDTKTGKKKWDKKRADETDQLTMYLFQIYLIHKIHPEKFECAIDWLPTHIKDGEVALIDETDIVVIKTKRSMTDILRFGNKIIETRKAMEEYYNAQ